MISPGRMLLLCSSLFAVAAPASAQRHEHAGAVASGEGRVTDAFARGLHLLHNFEYDRARAAFVQARAADRNSVMAAWGEAMTLNHPLWMEVDADAGRAALQRLGATSAERRAKARTGKERMWLEAVEALYAPTTKIARDTGYNRAMEAMFRAYPDDVDVRAFTALSIMGLAHNGREIPLYMRAAAMLEEVFPTNLKHPGVLHYLIHAYDDPDHAPLGLRAAELYGAVAPDAGHAMHMTSHIYLALGRWQEVERANLLAMGIVNRQRAATGMPATSCGHYAEWLVYARMQRGSDPNPLVDACRRQAEADISTAPASPGSRSLGSWADMTARIAVESGFPPRPIALPEGRFLMPRFWIAYASMIADGPATRRIAAQQELAMIGTPLLAELATNQPDDKSTPRWVERALAQGEAVRAIAEGKSDQGLQMLRVAADAERALPVEFGPPALPKPSIELLADTLLKMGRMPEAAAAYRATLALAPGRRRALAGLQSSGGATP